MGVLSSKAKAWDQPPLPGLPVALAHGPCLCCPLQTATTREEGGERPGLHLDDETLYPMRMPGELALGL